MSQQFKPIFSYNGDINKNAYMNWRTKEYDKPGNLFVIARGFRDAAFLMMDSILKDNSGKRADSLIFPIFYSVNQSIELYLKAILWNIEMLTSGKPNKYGEHDIQGLLGNLISQIRRKEVRTRGLDNYIKSLKEHIDELYSYIKEDKEKPKMDFARYPFDKEGNPFFYIVELDNVTVDIENFLKRYKEMVKSLEGLYYKYDNELEELMERDLTRVYLRSRLICAKWRK